MNRLSRLRLGLFAAGVTGLLALTVSNADDKPAPIKPAETPKSEVKRERVDPKPLTDSVKKGLEYLVKQQHPNGGWGQGGGWRTGDQGGGRVEGPELKDPPDVGNTAVAALALVRAGNTPKEGKYAKELAKAVEFICTHIEAADDKSLYITKDRGTQIQSKIGPYVDTFLASMLMAELKGKMQDDKTEKRLVAALDKTIKKIEKNQQADGTFAGNHGWASVLSQGIANKGLARAAQSGVILAEGTLDRIHNQVAMNFDGKSKEFRSIGGGGLGGGGVGGFGGAGRGGLGAGPTDAGVPIYSAGQTLTNFADLSAALKKAEAMAKETLAKKDATKEEKEKAERTIKQVRDTEQQRKDATAAAVKQLERPEFTQGFGSNGGEEFLSYMNISEALLLKGGDEWKKWDKAMSEALTRVQDKDGSWSGQHCITGKTFCTATALLVLTADRAPICNDVVKK